MYVFVYVVLFISRDFCKQYNRSNFRKAEPYGNLFLVELFQTFSFFGLYSKLSSISLPKLSRQQTSTFSPLAREPTITLHYYTSSSTSTAPTTQVTTSYHFLMASPLLRPSRDTRRKRNRERIRDLISRGMDMSQIEEELAKDQRITAQLHDSVVWEIRFPEVQKLLLQGLAVPAIEEIMRQKGWVWTKNLRNKATWEYHKDEIIELYKTLRSVDAVHAIMAKKGLAHKPRIYYDWLNNWGVSTSPKRPETYEVYDMAPTEISVSPLTDTSMNDNGTLALVTSAPAINNTTSNDRAYSNIHQDPGSMAIEDIFNPSNFHGSQYLDQSTLSPTRSLPNFPYLKSNLQNFQSNLQSLSKSLVSEDMFLVDSISNRSDEGGEHIGYEFASRVQASTALSSNTGTVVPLPVNRHSQNSSESNSGHWLSQTQRPASWNGPTMAQAVAGRSLSYWTDSDVASGTGSTRSSAMDTPDLLQSESEIRNSFSQILDSYGQTPQKLVLHSISCNENHRVIGPNYPCCGSSSLQDLAFHAKRFSPQEVHGLLRNYISEGAKLCDHAGNTFLHKLAILGAPWEYFEAAINAPVDPCHRNAYNQTFAHVLNISELQDKLMECLSFIRERGIDFSQRDASGWTVLHCLFSQPIPLQTCKEILKFVESPSHLYRRDMFGRTPRELFMQSFKQRASSSPLCGNPEVRLQNLGIFKDVGILKLGDEDVDWQRDINSSDEMRAKLQNQYRQVIKYAKGGIVVEAVDGSNALHAQAGLITAHDEASDISCIEKFISRGVDANGYDNRGRTPLEAIITQPRDYENELSKSRKVALLIDNGCASVHSRNRLGHTPLYSAAIRGLDRTVEVLLDRSSHVNIRANDNTSLLRAVQDAFDRALAEYKESQFKKSYHEAQCSRIETCKELLERYGAVLNPNPAQFMGYALSFPRFNDSQVTDIL